MKQIILLSIAVFSVINLYAQSIEEIEIKTRAIIKDYAKDIVCDFAELTSDYGEQKYKITTTDIDENGSQFEVHATLLVKCWTLKEVIPRSKNTTGGRIMNEAYSKKIPLKIIGKKVGEEIIISKLYFKRQNTYFEIFPVLDNDYVFRF